MAYKIEPKTVKEFIDMDTAFPRFQRKQTWKPKDNFKLCISVFKDYPVGVVIINSSDKYWVLDGRQRLNALTQMNRNPSEVYKWARSFIRFGKNDPDYEVKEKYWDKIDDYLQRDFEEDVYKEKDYKYGSDDLEESAEDSSDDYGKKEDEDNVHSYNLEDQKNNLSILLNYILMVHGFSKGKSKFERVFDFSKVIDNLSYYVIKDGKTCFAEENLVEMIRSIIKISKKENQKEIVTQELFINYFLKERYFKSNVDENFDKFTKQVSQNWDDIKNSFEVIDKVESVLRSSRIGIIEITHASNLDAQNMFSLVNTGGTLLTAEEILSAKPFWNKIVENPSNATVGAVDELYKELKVVQPDDVVRWDLCATLLSRIDRDGLIFDKTSKDRFAQQTTLGFKLMSALLLGGISSAIVSSLEKYNGFDWDKDYEDIIADLNNLIDLISQHDYFKCMKNWKQSIMGITSNTIALEFIVAMYKRWCDIGKKIVDSTETKRLKKEAVVLLDRLIYEYSTKMWRGSSDSKLATDIKPENIVTRIKEVSYENWKSIISSMSDGIVNDQPCTQNLVKPILYHSKFLKNEFSSVTAQGYDLDHIYPQKLFKSSAEKYNILKDSIINLEILSKHANESKNDKRLVEIEDKSIQDEISKSSYINIKDFVKYSDINNIEDLVKERKKALLSIFEKDRNKILNN